MRPYKIDDDTVATFKSDQVILRQTVGGTTSQIVLTIADLHNTINNYQVQRDND